MPPVEPAIITIFGITGDLAHRKLLPALYDLAKDDVLPEICHIVGVTRGNTTPVEVVNRIDKAVKEQGRKCDLTVLNRLEKAISIITMDITSEVEYRRLKQALDEIETK